MIRDKPIVNIDRVSGHHNVARQNIKCMDKNMIQVKHERLFFYLTIMWEANFWSLWICL